MARRGTRLVGAGQRTHSARERVGHAAHKEPETRGMTAAQTTTNTATEERSVERTHWVMKQMPRTVAAAQDLVMADWHPDQEPGDIWRAVNDAMMAAALGHENAAGDRKGESAESAFLAAVRRHSHEARAREADPDPQKVLDDALAAWRERVTQEVEASMASIPTNTGVCRLLDAVLVDGAIKVVVGAKTIYGESEIDQPWVLGDGESKKLLTKGKRNGDRIAVHASRDDQCTVITAVVEGMVLVDLNELLRAWGAVVVQP